LRIEINDEHTLADRGERGSKIDGGRGFADPAFLIGKYEYAQRPDLLKNALKT
jgi:hypothetical protein